MQIGLIGLGKMGYNLALNFKHHGHKVIAFDVSKGAMEKIAAEGDLLIVCTSSVAKPTSFCLW